MLLTIQVLVFIVRVPTFLVLVLFYLTKINFSNVDTLTNKCNELQVYLDTESPDIIGLCEISPKNAMDKKSISDLVLPSYERLVPAGVSKWAGTRYFYPPEIVYSTGRNY